MCALSSSGNIYARFGASSTGDWKALKWTDDYLEKRFPGSTPESLYLMAIQEVDEGAQAGRLPGNGLA